MKFLIWDLDAKSLTAGFIIGLSLTAASTTLLLLQHDRPKAKRRRPSHSHHLPDSSEPTIRNGVEGLIGNTHLFRIKSLSEATGCDILAKAEFLNVGGSTKDRVALSVISEAERKGLITPNTGCTIFEGTVGSTGISLAVIARAKGYKCHIVMPDDQAKEKYELLEKLGATVEKVRPVSIVDKNHFVNLARRRADEMNQKAEREGGPRGFFCDQFENLANYQVHYTTTGPEIYAQTAGNFHAIVLGAGTGGTLAGVTHYLKPRVPSLLSVLADPWGSGLYHKVKHNIMYSPTEAEGTRRRYQVDTVVEGVGINRMTKNFEKIAKGWIDEAIKVTDQEAVEMARYLVKKDGALCCCFAFLFCLNGEQEKDLAEQF
ncbi:Cysteine synthase 2 [Rhizophlyctis rosea]|nr:Cysteine synthase 2 [Rhizophlyctis rosea]